MKTVAKSILAAVAFCGALTVSAIPASAHGHIGITFGWFGSGFVPFGDPCDYYNYYDAPPPWGLPPDYCDYPVFFGSVFWNDMWFRGPIYYRWVDGQRLFWLNGGWHADHWHGPRPHIFWRDHGPNWDQPHYYHHYSYGRGGYGGGPDGHDEDRAPGAYYSHHGHHEGRGGPDGGYDRGDRGGHDGDGGRGGDRDGGFGGGHGGRHHR